MPEPRYDPFAVRYQDPLARRRQPDVFAPLGATDASLSQKRGGRSRPLQGLQALSATRRP